MNSFGLVADFGRSFDSPSLALVGQASPARMASLTNHSNSHTPTDRSRTAQLLHQEKPLTLSLGSEVGS